MLEVNLGKPQVLEQPGLYKKSQAKLHYMTCL